jgi:hypothetical protein
LSKGKIVQSFFLENFRSLNVVIMCQIVADGSKRRSVKVFFFFEIFPSRKQLQRRFKLFALNEGTLACATKPSHGKIEWIYKKTEAETPRSGNTVKLGC